MRIVGDETEVYNYGELLETGSLGCLPDFEQEDIEFGDRVALIGENHPCWAIAYLGTLFRGAVCVPIDPHGEIETITNFLENSDAKLAFLSPEFNRKISTDRRKTRSAYSGGRLAEWRIRATVFRNLKIGRQPNFLKVLPNRKRRRKPKTPRF